MPIIKFDLKQDYRFPVSGFVTDEAKAFAKFLIEAGNDEGRTSYDADNYTELNAISPANIGHRCIATAPILDERSVRMDACGGRDRTFVHYSTTQECLYFAPEGTPFEVATIMAAVAVACGDVEQSIVISRPSVSETRWEISAPADIPATILAEAFGTEKQTNAYIIPRKEAAV